MSLMRHNESLFNSQTINAIDELHDLTTTAELSSVASEIISWF